MEKNANNTIKPSLRNIDVFINERIGFGYAQ
jgi:hypothetical protein